MTEDPNYSVTRIPHELIDNPPPNFEAYWAKYKKILDETGREE
tara:strand:+ start:770 stop:898 length:129 start_codon:yes stop_codon:yes gene_type:complete